MYKGLFFIIIILFLFSCSNREEIKQLIDDEFFESISSSKDFRGNQDFRGIIKKVDSVFKYGEYHESKNVILFQEKGRALNGLRKHIEAINCFKQAEFFFNDETDKILIADNSKYFGQSYIFISQLDTAKFHIKSAIKLYKDMGDKRGESRALSDLGHLFYKQEDYSASALHVKKAIEIQLELNNKEELSASYLNIGFILKKNKKYDQAISYYKKAIALNETMTHNKDAYAVLNTATLIHLGALYFIQNNMKKSKSFYLQALRFEEEFGENYNNQKRIYDALIEISVKDKDLSSIPIFISKKDSVSKLIDTYDNQEMKKLMSAKHEQFITQENLKQELELNKKNKLILGITVGLLLLLCVVIYQKSRNSSLELKQQTLELEQKILRTQMNPHFIFNTLTAIQNKVFDNQPLQQVTFISKFATLIRQNFNLVNQKEISLTEDIDALTNYIETQQFRFNNKFDYVINIGENINPDKIKIPPMMLQIFVENAIEHGLKSTINKGKLIINIKAKKDFVKFEIIDDGVGFSKHEVTEEHAIDVFKKRLQLRKLGEEKLFSIQSSGVNLGTKVVFELKLAS